MRDYDKIEKTLYNLERELRSSKDYESSFDVKANTAPCPSFPNICFPIKNVYDETVFDLIIKDINSGLVNPQELDWLKLTLYDESFIKIILKGLYSHNLKPTVLAIQKEMTQSMYIHVHDYSSPYYLSGDGNQYFVSISGDSSLWAQTIEKLLETELADRKRKSTFVEEESKNPCLDDPTFLTDADKQISDCCTFPGAIDEELLHTVLMDQNFDNHNWRTFFHDFSGGFEPARLFGQICNKQTLKWCYEDILKYAETNSSDLFFSSYDSNINFFRDECELSAFSEFERNVEHDIKAAYSSVVRRNKMLADRQKLFEDRIKYLSEEEQADYNQCCEEQIMELIGSTASARELRDNSYYSIIYEENKEYKSRIEELEEQLIEAKEEEMSIVQTGQKSNFKTYKIKAGEAVKHVKGTLSYSYIKQQDWEQLLSKLTGLSPKSFHNYWSKVK